MKITYNGDESLIYSDLKNGALFTWAGTGKVEARLKVYGGYVDLVRALFYENTAVSDSKVTLLEGELVIE